MLKNQLIKLVRNSLKISCGDRGAGGEKWINLPIEYNLNKMM